MPPSSTAILLSSVALLAVTAFFLLALVPLLLLQHRSPQDSEVVVRLLHAYGRVAMVASAATALSYGLAGMMAPAVAAAALAGVAVAMHRRVLPAMASLRASLPFGPATRTRFRRLHTGAIAVNLAQLVAAVGIVHGASPLP